MLYLEPTSKKGGLLTPNTDVDGSAAATFNSVQNIFLPV
jgi:hypothetical protein